MCKARMAADFRVMSDSPIICPIAYSRSASNKYGSCFMRVRSLASSHGSGGKIRPSSTQPRLSPRSHVPYVVEVSMMPSVLPMAAHNNVHTSTCQHLAPVIDRGLIGDLSVHHQRIHIAMPRMAERSRKRADDLKAKTLPQAHCVLVGADNEIELHGPIPLLSRALE